MGRNFSFSGELWEWTGEAAWHFISLPEDLADDIEAEFGHRAGGFGSVRVEVGIGSSTWRTSLFPSTEHRTYLLPIKKPVRKAEELVDGSTADVQLKVLVD